MGCAPLLRFDGRILGASFASGDRFVVGRWHDSPFGGFADLMWARPDGRRVLVADRDDVLAFIGSHYRFDRPLLGRVDARKRGDRVEVDVPAVGLRLELELRPPDLLSALLRARPRRLRTAPAWIGVEDALLRPLVSPLLGGSAAIRARGRTRTGAREWYAIADRREARHASASLAGHDLGPPAPARAPAGFGFSEFPPRPGVVRVTALIEDLETDRLRPTLQGTSPPLVV